VAFNFEMQKNAFGGRALPGPAGELTALSGFLLLREVRGREGKKRGREERGEDEKGKEGRT